jgi:hypothetical protein
MCKRNSITYFRLQVGDRTIVRDGTCRKAIGEGHKSGEEMIAGPLSLARKVHDIQVSGAILFDTSQI